MPILPFQIHNLMSEPLRWQHYWLVAVVMCKISLSNGQLKRAVGASGDVKVLRDQLAMTLRVGELRRWLLTPPGQAALARIGAPPEATLRWSIENEDKLVAALLRES